MKPFLRMLSAVTLLILHASQASAGIVYAHDDGSGEISIGFSGNTSQTIWLNQFTVAAGGEQLTSIDIAFGSNSTQDPPSDGTPIVAYLWTSATNNIDPTVDATVVANVNGTIQQSHTDTFISFALPTAVDLSIGDVFFAGFQSTGFAVANDDSSSAGKSWFFSDNSTSLLDPDALNSMAFGDTFDGLGIPGNALIRVNSASTTPSVPAPPTLALLLAPALLMGAVRRKRLSR